MKRRDFLTKGLLTASILLITSCRGFGAAEHRYQLAPETSLPPDIAKAPEEVREAYRFAIANRDTFRYIPCYCGCGSEGHEQRVVLPEGRFDSRESAIRSNEPCLRYLHRHHA